MDQQLITIVVVSTKYKKYRKINVELSNAVCS